MGACTSQANIPRQYSPLRQAIKSVPTNSSAARIVNPDFRMILVGAYIHHIKQTYHIIHKISQSITFLIVAYYPKYTIYGIKATDIEPNCKLKKLNQFENTLLNLHDIFSGHNKFFINNIYNEIQTFNGFKYSHNSGSNKSEQSIKKHNQFHLPKLQLIRNSHSSQLNKWLQFQDTQKRKYRSIVIKITQIECGISHVLLLSSKGTVYTMGLNHNGECGITKYQANIQNPTLIEQFTDNGCNIQSISCGDYHSCCLDGVTKLLYTFGKNQFRQCTSNATDNILVPIIPKICKDKNIIKAKCGRDFTICLDDNGGLMTFGNILIEYDNLELMEMNGYVSDFSVGYDHVIIINDEQQISMVEPRVSDFVQQRTAFFIDDDSFEMFPFALTIGDNAKICAMVTASKYSLIIFQMTVE
eukprot:479749_1